MYVAINLTAYGQSDIGLVRQRNEDAFVVADLTGGGVLQEPRMVRFEIGERGALLAVSDGLGGHRGGEVASALVVESLCRTMSEQAGRESSEHVVQNATARANREVWEAAHRPGLERMGATLTALYIH